MEKFKNLILFITVVMTAVSFSACSSDEDVVEPVKITFANEAITLYVGESQKLQYEVKSGAASTSSIEFRCDNPQVVNVENGTIKALMPGAAKVTLLYDKSSMATCQVTVVPVEVSQIVFDKSDLELTIGDNATLSYTIKPENATYKDVVWESKDSEIATVSDLGTITAVGVGKTIITAKVPNSEIKSECNVTVNPIHVSSVTCSPSEAKVLLGGRLQLTHTVSPDNATDQSVIWSSSNPRIANVSNDGTVSGYELGNAVITVSSVDGGKKAESTIKVANIDEFVTVQTSVGSEGSSSTGFYSYLRLKLNTNVSSSIYINSIILTDADDYVRYIDSANGPYTSYTNKYITAQHGNHLNNTYSADGWKVVITYTWRDQIFKIVHINK